MDMNTQMRLTGLATGLDTDQIIQNLGRVHSIRIDSVKRDKQIALWRQESVRNTIDIINNFTRKNLDIVNPTTNFRSPTAFAKFSFNLSLPAGSSIPDVSRIMSVTANADLKNLNQSVQAVAQLASKDTWTGDTVGLNVIRTDGFSTEHYMDPLVGGMAYFGVSIDGVSRTVSLNVLEISGDYLATHQKIEPGEDVDLSTPFGGVVSAHIIRELSDYRDEQLGPGDVGLRGEIDQLISDLEDGTIATLNDARAAIQDIVGLDPGFVDDLTEQPLLIEVTPDIAAANEAFVNALNAEITRLFGSDYQNIVKLDGGELTFSKPASNITIFDALGGAGNHLERLGLPTGGASTGNVHGKTLEEMFDSDFFKNSEGVTIDRTIWINGVNIAISATDTIATMTNKINTHQNVDGRTANVELIYNSASDKFVLTSKQDGAAADIQDVTGTTAQFFEMLKLGEVDGGGQFEAHDRSKGTNLIAVINGQEFVRPSNSFHFEGMNYNFHNTFNTVIDVDGNFRNVDGTVNIENPSDEIKISVNRNNDEIIDSIKAFVDEYNAIIDHINGLLTEKRDSDFRPLSDDEKKAMKDDEIKAYEEKARMGTMSNDADLRKLLDQMRSAVYAKVDGVGITMSNIGITTTSNWKDGGRLVIDEDKLRTALENNYQDVVSLFTNSSDIPATDMANRGKRSAESGIAQRLNDIFGDAARTTQVGFSNKGYLVERAGVLGDASVGDNQIQTQIDAFDKRIETLMGRWQRQEAMHYQMFARMETAMMRMQAQQNSLASIMAQSGQ